MAANEFSEKHRIVYYEADDTDQLTLAKLIDLFVLVSEDQNADLGITTEKIQSLGVGWVVTQYHIQIDQLPRTGETVTVKTRATAYNRYFAYREYWLLDATGKQLAYGEGIWVTMSYETRKIATIPAAIMAPYHSDPVTRLPRLPRPDRDDATATSRVKPYTVRYFDIDHNGHVNNAHYFDWMLDTLPAEFLRHHHATDVRIRFENEVKYGQQVTSAVTQPELTTTQHVVSFGTTTAVRATVQWTD
ncbi:acyl-ACP thioesterase [Levilactobacillus koreensis JCM 16448]|uniref:Acyl-ACP thioesterase n=1 Tax=Levilactobacillus koreensis TaxID=637971 RepID=A0AAC8UTC3_9LACO|nr:acyl-ACP thioesterase domain-containing protein [Levilactobacillus koreensis]AKP63845.1 acyl-ACP thioesterase [Levilactobacillus koreensis]KRK90696.1 acyl-ACP thioesterase [Levilactobacillus koreensis JCM 16448]